MLSEFGIAKRVWSCCTALLVVAGFAACVDDSVAPAPEATPPAKSPRVIGFAELTFTGIGTPDLSSSMLVAPTLEALEELRAQRERSGDLRDFVAQDLTLPQNQDGSGSGTIQLALDQRQEFPPVGGVRYLNATYAVRNAQHDSAAGSGYDMERTNLTFLGVSSNNTINQTAVRQLLLDGGAPAPAALALEVLPTDLLTAIDTPLVAAHPDVLQIFSEAEVAALTPPAGVTSVFPYGFVVRLVGSTTDRTLPASPPVGTFHGIVDFGFSIPAQPNSDQDPQTLSVLMLAVDDSETQMTQGLLEQTPEATEALRQLASSLNADTVTLLPGGSLPGDSLARTLCSVRTAGTPAAATAHLLNVDWTFQSFSPSPNSSIAGNAAFQATFSAPVEGAGPDNFIVRGLQSGTAFPDTSYSDNGTATIQTPAGNFFAGEEVEVTLTSELACPTPSVARYRVEASGTAAFDTANTMLVAQNDERFTTLAIADVDQDGSLDIVASRDSANSVLVLWDGTAPLVPITAGTSPISTAIGDLNGDGLPDLVTANSSSNDVSVILNEGNRNFQPPQPVAVSSSPSSVTLGDLNGNGILDIATTNGSTNDVSILLGNGDGTFQPSGQTLPMGTNPVSAVLGDLNRDDVLDIVTGSAGVDSISVRLGNGDGMFQAQQMFALSGQAHVVALGDLNSDGILDAVVGNGSGAATGLSVLMGTGTGSFQSEQTYPSGLGGSISLAIGHLNSDPYLDVVDISNNNDFFVRLGSPTGVLSVNQQLIFPNRQPITVALGEFRGNGELDVVSLVQFLGSSFPFLWTNVHLFRNGTP